jgi:hypothetical protein
MLSLTLGVALYVVGAPGAGGRRLGHLTQATPIVLAPAAVGGRWRVAAARHQVHGGRLAGGMIVTSGFLDRGC